MSREYFAVFSRMFTTGKYRQLTDSQFRTLMTLWAIAGNEEPEAIWRDKEWLGKLLALHDRPPDDVRALIDAGWLDRLEDDAIAVHDWDEWQLAGSKRVHDDWEAARKREWRRQNPRSSRSSEPDKRRGDKTRQDKRSPDNVRTPYVHSSNGENGAAPPRSSQKDLEHVSGHLPPITEMIARGDKALSEGD